MVTKKLNKTVLILELIFFNRDVGAYDIMRFCVSIIKRIWIGIQTIIYNPQLHGIRSNYAQ
jgi:hypothetical protein